MRVRIAVLLTLVFVAVFLGRRAWRQAQRLRVAGETCEAARRGDWERAESAAAGFEGRDPAAVRVAECLCLGDLSRGLAGTCAGRVEGLVADDSPLPAPLFLAVAARARLEAHDVKGAVSLARRGAERYPESEELLSLELAGRRRVEPLGELLTEFEARLEEAGEAAPALRMQLAALAAQVEDWERVLALAGESEPEEEGRYLEWYSLRSRALAGLGRADALWELLERRRRRRGDEAEALALYVHLRARHALDDPRASEVELLEALVERAGEIADPVLGQWVFDRLIRNLVGRGRHDRALALFDRGVELYDALGNMTRDEILRARTQAWADRLGRDRIPPGRLRFVADRVLPGDLLWTSQPEAAGVDAPFRRHPFDGGGGVTVERGLEQDPVRWVWRDSEDRAVGSGAAWASPGETISFALRRREPAMPPGWELDLRSPGDGRRRVFLLVLDCGDWRLVRYLVERRMLPALAGGLARGTSGVLLSDPPFTAAALQVLVDPTYERSTVFGWLHELGAEIEGLTFVGRNPVGVLEWLLPAGADLFTVVGETERVAANLLRPVGSVAAGRHALLTGPEGRQRTLSGYAGTRPLRPEELAGVPALDLVQADFAPLVAEVAADLDAVTTLAREGEVDLVAARVAALDLVTHSSYARVTSSGQDDGHAALFGLYAYLDFRLAALSTHLDADDVLLVLSDHGIRNAIEHDPRAFFVAVGGDVLPGRLEGMPHLRGVARAVTDLVGVPTDWPDTGVQIPLRRGAGSTAL